MAIRVQGMGVGVQKFEARRTRRRGGVDWAERRDPDGQKIFWPRRSAITVERNVRFDDGSVFGEGTSEGGVLTSEQQSQQSPAQTAPRNLKTQSHTSQKTLSRSGSSRPTRRIEKGTRKPASAAADVHGRRRRSGRPGSPGAVREPSDVEEERSRRVRNRWVTFVVFRTTRA
jgi:hypothetical protein